jgi:general secretion pathway protein D
VTAPELAQIKGVIASLDSPPTAPIVVPGLPESIEGIRLLQGDAASVARAVSHTFPRIAVSVVGGSIVLRGGPEDVAKAKALVAQLDSPAPNAEVTVVHRLHASDAKAAADLLARAYPAAKIGADVDLNAISVTASDQVQRRISDSVSQLEGMPAPGNPLAPGLPGNPGVAVPQGVAAGGFEVVTLRSIVPAQGAAGSNASDAANAIAQTLQQLVPSVKVTTLSVPGRISLSGDPYSVRQAKDILAKIDVPAPLVVLDTEILEIDESVARNLGLLLTSPVLSTTYSEIAPPANNSTGASVFQGIEPITRTPLSLQVQLNLQIQKGNARVLADPRITTLSGHTASIKAGDTISILTTAGGGAGTVATTQVQSFQTGVTLDITPVVTAEGKVSVALHPTVNSLSGIVNGVPQISTRDAQTVVQLKNNQTLVIGGLIQEDATGTQNKIPILGDIPLVGNLFRNTQYSSTKNELVIVVTPHILEDGEQVPVLGPPLPAIPTPRPLPTIAAPAKAVVPRK